MANTRKRKQGNNYRGRLQLNHAAKYSFVLLLIAVQTMYGKTQSLNNVVSIKANNQALSQVLFKLSEQAHFDFSYDTRVIPPQQTVSISAQNQPLAQVLNSICSQSNIQYKEIGNQIIFFRAERENTPKVVSHLISGQVVDYHTGEKLKGVVVSEKYFQLNTNTNAQGGYQLSVPNPNYTIQLSYNLQGYEKKSYLVKVKDSKTLNVSLKSQPDTATAVAATAPSVQSISLGKALTQQMLEVEFDSVKLQNITTPLIQNKSLDLVVSKKQLDSLKTDTTLNVVPVQFSIIPGVGYNAQFGGKNLVKGFSFSLFGGLNAGVDGVELASIININRFNVKGFQAAGIANLVGGQTTGFQVAGITNITKLKAFGVQAAGIYNFAGQEMEGAQFAGISNFVLGKMDGAQFSGVYNIATGNGKGTQMAGFGNTIGKDFIGLQASGFINIVRGKIEGTQMAGAINLAKEVNGTQISGLLNYTGKLKGVQIGVFNFVDSADGGVPIGVFNYVKNGYRRWEIQGMETGIVSLKFKSGTHRFYTFVGLGGRDNGNGLLWDISYGAGTVFRAQKPLFFTLEASSHWLNPASWSKNESNLYRADFNMGVRLHKRWALVVGPSFNVYVVNKEVAARTNIYKPHLFINQTAGKTNVQAWFGLNAAIQF